MASDTGPDDEFDDTIDQYDSEILQNATFARTNARIYPVRTPTRFRKSRRSPSQRQDFHPITGIPNMSAQVRIQGQAHDVLSQLQTLPDGPFGPEHQLLIAKNMGLVQGVTADSLEERGKADERRKGIERRAREALKLKNPNYAVNIESDSEDEFGDGGGFPTSGGGGGGGGSGGKKRRRPDSGSDDDEEANKAAKRARRYANPELQIREPVDIVKLAPLPIQMTYAPHPSTDRPDIWFIDNFASLYRQMERVFSVYYALHDIPMEAEPWAECKMPPEFVKWAEKVAEPNPRMGSWDELLRDKETRKWFLIGIVMKILKVKVFDEYLFGGTKEQKTLMHQTDRALLGRDGFQREEIRATQARTILGSSPVTETFYYSVSKLTAQIAIMLSPLTCYLYSLPPPENTPAPRIRDLHQSLHNLVSHAAYLSLCIKVTPTIIQIHDLRPGDQWQPDDMHCIDTDGYVESKRMICEDYKQERHNLKAFARACELDADAHRPPVRGGRITKKYKEKLALATKMQALLTKKEETDHHPTYTHRALIKLAVWPVIRRYSPGSVEDDAVPNRPLREKDGFRIFLIGKGGILAYYGRDHKKVEEHSGLEEWVATKLKQGKGRWVGVAGGLGGVVSAASFVAITAVVGLRRWVPMEGWVDGTLI